MNYIFVFIISFTHGLVATLEVIHLSHLRAIGTAIYGTLNSAFAFALIYIVVVDETSGFMLVFPWVVGDVIAGQIGLRVFKRRK